MKAECCNLIGQKVVLINALEELHLDASAGCIFHYRTDSAILYIQYHFISDS